MYLLALGVVIITSAFVSAVCSEIDLHASSPPGKVASLEVESRQHLVSPYRHTLGRGTPCLSFASEPCSSAAASVGLVPRSDSHRNACGACASDAPPCWKRISEVCVAMEEAPNRIETLSSFARHCERGCTRRLWVFLNVVPIRLGSERSVEHIASSAHVPCLARVHSVYC